MKQVDGDPGQLETLVSGKVVAKKNGYVYVFTSNESQEDVFFDNLGVMLITGPVLEETHYYPFGLTMAGISTVAPLKLVNKHKFNSIELNNKEFSDGSGLDLYTAYYRSLDPQIGRWWQVDPMATSFPGISGYSLSFDNPVNLSDPLGDCPTCPVNGNEGDIWNYMGQRFLNIGGQWIGSGPETVVTASLLGNFLRHDVLNQRFVSSGFWQLTNRPNNELPYLQGQIPISIEPISGPDRTQALFTHYKTPQDRAREATIDYYKDVDFAHGQLMPPRSWVWDLIFGARKAFNGQYVGENGYPLPLAQQAIQRQADYDIALFSIIGGPGKLFRGGGLLEDIAKTGTGYANDAIRLTTSSKSLMPSRTYTIFDGSGQLYKFGVTDANLIRYEQSLREAGPGAYGSFSSIVPKNQAHLIEKYLRSLHYNSTGQYALPGMKIPYPVNFNTGLPIKP